MIGLVVAMLAAAIGIVGLGITASRDSVDDALVTEKVDELLAAAPAAVEAPAGESVLPVFVPKAELLPVPATEINVSYAPAVPPASGRTTPAIVEVHFEVVENVVAIDPATGVEYETWGFRLNGDSQVNMGTPGPMIRARVGDVLRFTLTNPATSTHPHNIDLHAVTGQGGGAADTTVAPGETKTIEARMLYPGMFMYHCAYGDVPLHIAHGMYGGILVDPAEPLPTVEQEVYMVQSEYYTNSTEPGLVETDRQSLTDENPSMVVFNGAKGALSGDNTLTMAVGDTMRIYFVNAGLNLDSNFHPIGSHWDAVYPEAALLNPPIRGSQTTLVAAGGGTVVELIGQVPSTIVLVDHALTRTFDKGALGTIVVTGEANPEIFEALGDGVPATDDSPAAVAGETVEIVAGSWNVQDMDAPDEFAADESPADYSINELRIAVGTTVTWINNDEQIHTVTDVDGAFDSGFFATGESWSYTFDTVGEFEYFCIPHPWMRAKVIVEG
ncbi:MAG: multicopper oxidase domain-containing protein [Acidimicrobiia bacterium]|nr:multicopper oxidase domain-containing protein [Acidimicrobiia bacterium]